LPELDSLQKVFRPLGIHLMRQGHELRYVSRVFEDDHVMGIEAYGSMVFSSMKQILNDVHDTVVTLFRKQRSYSLIRFVHEIV
jgi:predicted transcriptional regulator